MQQINLRQRSPGPQRFIQVHTKHTSADLLVLVDGHWELPAYHTKSQNHAAPEEDVVQQSAASNPLAPLQHYNRHLEHHRNKAVASELSCDTSHDEFMCQGGNEKGDCRGQRTRHVIL
jgi:hypothetical protein